MHSQVERITTTQLLGRLADPDMRLIDVRSPDAYNGWRMQREPRGGHIASACNIPYRWTDYLDWPEIIKAKQVRPGQPTVVYGYRPEESIRVAQHLKRLGIDRIAVYGEFVEEWCPEEKLPMQRLARYRHLVPPSWVAALIRTGTAPEYEGNHTVLCHSYYRNRQAYDDGHIPGAVALDTLLLESPETWNRRSPEELSDALERLGISHDTTVILYGRYAFPDPTDPFPGSSAGQLAAFRCAFIMLYAGVSDVRVLNGGLRAWQDAGYLPTREPTKPPSRREFGISLPAHPEYAVDLPEAKEILRADDALLISVRSWAEFIGEESGYNYIRRKGRIPGAVFGNCGSDAYHMENYRNLDLTCREYHEIERMWAEVGIMQDKRNVFYCGTGWRGSEAFFNAWLMGWPRVAVFDGGWFEWSSDEGNPCEVGIPHTAHQKTMSPKEEALRP